MYFPLKCFSRLRGADVVVLPEKLNFGAPIFLCDIARRMYADKNVVFMVFQNFTHNPLFPEIWWESEKFDYVSISRCGFHHRVWGRKVSLPNRKVFDPLAVRFAEWLARLLGRDPLIIRSMADLFSRVEVPETLRWQIAEALEKSPGNPVIETCSVEMPYTSLYYMRREIPVPNPSLPVHMRDTVERALVAARGGREGVRLCGLYMKRLLYSVAPLPEKQLKWLQGSDFECYLPAVRLMVDRGYQVLLTGDVDIPADVAEEFAGMFVDARSLGIDVNLFRLYAALNTDAFIGDCGGGWLFGGLVVDRTMLGLNIFPFFTSTGKFWLCYKHAYDSQGNHIPFRDIVEKYPFPQYFPDEYDILPNTADEIFEAVRCYLDEIERPGSSEVDSDLENLWPEYSLFKMSGGHVSPAFVKTYYEQCAKKDVA
jgi:putative glycosyltransferase (TIGR04372 family)